MLKGIGKKLNERFTHIRRTQDIQKHAAAILKHYAITASAQYDYQQDILTIQAQTKTGASELMLHMADITELLRHTGYGVRRILIR